MLLKKVIQTISMNGIIIFVLNNTHHIYSNHIHITWDILFISISDYAPHTHPTPVMYNNCHYIGQQHAVKRGSQ